MIYEIIRTMCFGFLGGILHMANIKFDSLAFWEIVCIVAIMCMVSEKCE